MKSERMERIRSTVVSAVAILLCACGGGGGSGSPPPVPVVAISPTRITLDANSSTTFQGSGGTPPYTFAVSSGLGTVFSSGLYSATNAGGAATVTVTDSKGGSASGSVTINTPLSILPPAIAMAINTIQTFTAYGGSPPYTYSIVNGAGNLDARLGTYQAGGVPGMATIGATDSLGSTVNTSVTVNSGLAIAPASITMTSGSGQTYGFAGQNGALQYQYVVVSGSGSIDASGIFTVGTHGGTTVVKVTDRQGTSATATVQSLHVRTNGPVYSAITDGANWYLGGLFSAVNPYQTSRMTSLDPASGAPILACDFAGGFDNDLLTSVYAGGALYVGGYFQHYRGVAVPGGLVRLDPKTCALTGTYFSASDGAGYVSAIALVGSSVFIASDARIYRGQALNPYGNSLIKIDAVTGQLDAAFSQSTAFNGPVRRMIATPTELYAAGEFSGPINTSVGSAVVRIDAATGVLDTAFAPTANLGGIVQAMALDGNSLYVGGWFSNQFGNLIKVDATTGALDSAFNQTVGFNSNVRDLLLSGTSLYVAGDFSLYNGLPAVGVARLDAVNGTLDTTFTASTGLSTTSFFGNGRALAMSGNALYVGGAFTSYRGQPAMRLAKLDATTGRLDPNFTQATGLDNYVNTLAASDTAIYPGGIFRTYRGAPVSNIAKMTIDGTMDTAFLSQGGFNGKVVALSLVGSDLYVAGSFTSFAGASANYVAKLNGVSGSLDHQFTQSAGLNAPTYSMTTNGTALYLGGGFTTYRGIACNALAKLDLATGDVDSNFVQAAALPGNTIVSTVAINGNFLYLGDNSPTYGGVTTGVGRVDAATGASDSAFAQNSLGAYTYSYAFSPNAVYIGGNYGAPITKFDIVTGVLDPAFVPVQGANASPIRALALANGALYVGGQYPSGGIGPFDRMPAKLNPATGVYDPAFSLTAAIDGDIYVIQPSTAAIYIAGEFTTYRGAPAYYFGLIDPASGGLIEP